MFLTSITDTNIHDFYMCVLCARAIGEHRRGSIRNRIDMIDSSTTEGFLWMPEALAKSCCRESSIVFVIPECYQVLEREDATNIV